MQIGSCNMCKVIFNVVLCYYPPTSLYDKGLSSVSVIEFKPDFGAKEKRFHLPGFSHLVEFRRVHHSFTCLRLWLTLIKIFSITMAQIKSLLTSIAIRLFSVCVKNPIRHAKNKHCGAEFPIVMVVTVLHILPVSE